MSASESLVDIRGMTKYFYQNTSLLDRLDPNTQQEKVHAVDGVDLEIQRGDVMGVVGESGCGKSTLARSMLRLIEPTDGSVYFDGDDIMEYSSAELKQFRRRAQLVYQDPSASLNPRHSVGRIVKKPMNVHDIGDSKQDRDERALELIRRVGLEDEHYEAHPHQLSGGQKQRVAIARALALEPDLLVADEPTSTLDASVQARILNLLDSLQEEEDLTMMFISHDLSVIRYISDRVSVMYLGQVVENAPTRRIFEDPKHPYTETLFSSIPVPDPNQADTRVRLKGDVPSPINPPDGCRFHTRCPKQIPPEGWSNSQDAWVELYNVKLALQTRLEESESDSPSVDPDQVLSYFSEGGREELSGTSREVLGQVRDDLGENELERAYERLDSEFVSPCEVDAPERLQESADHDVRCLLYGDSTTADERVETRVS